MSHFITPSDITLNLSTQDFASVVPFLISNGIGFKATYNEETSLPQPTIPKSEIQLGYANFKSSKLKNIEDIYEKYIVKNIDSCPPKESDIAKQYNMSLIALRNNFKKKYGMPFFQLYMNKKMEHAAELLKNGITATVISEKIGYSHPIKFNKMFQKHFGITPKKYQMQHRGIK